MGPFLRAAKWRALSLERLNDRAPQILPPTHGFNAHVALWLLTAARYGFSPPGIIPSRSVFTSAIDGEFDPNHSTAIKAVVDCGRRLHLDFGCRSAAPAVEVALPSAGVLPWSASAASAAPAARDDRPAASPMIRTRQRKARHHTRPYSRATANQVTANP